MLQSRFTRNLRPATHHHTFLHSDPIPALVSQLKGIPTNLELCAAIAASDKFAAGDTTTSFLVDFPFAPHAVEVVAAGMNTTVQV